MVLGGEGGVVTEDSPLLKSSQVINEVKVSSVTYPEIGVKGNSMLLLYQNTFIQKSNSKFLFWYPLLLEPLNNGPYPRLV